MFRRSLASSSSRSARSLSSLVVRPMATLTLSPRALPSAASFRSPVFQGAFRCKTTYEDSKHGTVTAFKDLNRDWAAKGPVSFDEMKELSKGAAFSTDVMILDVRELAEIQQGNIPSSLPLPLSMLEDSLKLDPLAWEEKLGFKKPGRDQPIVVYCRSGKRSQSAMDKMTTEGDVEHRFTNIRNYSGSWLDWSEKYKPSEDEDDF